MKTVNRSVATAVCAMMGALSFPPHAAAEIMTATVKTAGNRNTGMEFLPGDGKPGHFRLVCHDVSAYQALVAIARRRGYELTFDQAGEAACRRTTLNGIYCQPWMGLEMANIEAIIVESISANADLPRGCLLRFIRAKGTKGLARIVVIPRSALDANGQLMTPISTQLK
jgi:hypothetical protein